jgi:hypothetical protein
VRLDPAARANPSRRARLSADVMRKEPHRKRLPRRSLALVLVAGVALAATGCDKSQATTGSAERTAAAATPVRVPSKPPLDRMLAPAELAKTLADPAAKKPLILFVGPEQLYVKHIPGAKNAGEAGEPEGLATFTAMITPLPRDTDIVIYCGCCPPRNCPNIKPAWAKLAELGFTNARVLDLPQTFRADWREKGYPVEP